MKKRIISLLLSLTMIISMMPMFTTTASAAISAAATLEDAVTTGASEDYTIYLAWYHTFYNSDGHDVWLKRWSDTNAFNTFAELYDKEALRSFLLTKFAQMGYTDEVKFYEGLLFSLLGTNQSTSSDTTFKIFDTDEYEKANILVALANEVFSGETILTAAMALDKLKELGSDLKPKVGAAAVKLGKVNKLVGYIGDYGLNAFELLVNHSENTEEANARLQNIINTCQVAEGYERLFEILSTDENDVIREVATPVYQYMSSDDFASEVQDWMETLQKAEDWSNVEDITSAVFSLVPYAGTAFDIADLLFGLKDEGESIYVMWMLRDMNNSIARAAGILREDFRGDPTSTPAADYIMTMDLWYRFLYKTCAYTEEHIEDIFKSGLKEGVVNQENYEIYLEQVEKEKDLVLEKYATFYSAPEKLFEDYLKILNSNYTITYNANGGTGAPTSHENTDGPTTISTTVPTRTGFTFLGWSESATATTATYQPGDTLTKEGSVTLYAVWQAGTFDIVFHANGGVYADNSDSKTMQKTYLQNFTVNPEIPTRDGYVFSGYWTLNDDGSGTQYTQGKTYSDIGGAGLSAKHLYAHWTKVKTEVTFRYDYTNCTYTDITIPLTNGSASITLIDPPAEKIAEIGKEFVQWKYYYPDGSGYKYYQTGDTITLTDDMTLYAEWADPAGDTLLSVLTDKTSYLPGDTVKIYITADNSGYFTVDASDNTGFTIQNAEGGKTATGVFVENSSESTSTNLKCYDNGSVYTVMLYIPNNCSDGAYTVDIVASNGTYGVSGTETSTASETITVTVDTSEEEVASYVLSYNLNGGYGTIPDSEYFEEDDHVELADDSSFQRDGYEFGGWSKNSDGSGKTYKAGKDYQFTESTQLYAIWEPVAADADELSLALGVERYSKVYKPGETAHIIVSPDNSDHFFIDVSDCAGFTVLSAMGTKLTEATYIEYSSPAFISGRDGYTDGSNKYIPVYIPSNCKDGQYTFFVTATDGILDQTSGETIKCSVTIYVRESDIPDSIQLSKSEITLHVGDEKRLKATVEPQYIFNEYNEKEVTWSTSNKNVASIDDKGNSVDISGVKSGTATITATVDGISASCTVTVVSCDHSLKIVEPEYLASAATCKKQAEYYYVCSCGDVGSATYKVGELADHNYSAWTVIQQATETTAGVEQRVCSACGATEERSIPATGAHTTHTPGTAWYSDSEKHWHVCSVDGCTVKLNEDTHDFGELSVETPATETNTGIGYRTCELCGYTKSEVIPVLEPTLYTVTVTNGSGDGEYAAGATVLISADAPESGKQFKEWVGLDGVNIISGSIHTATVVFTMPQNAVNASATYEDIPVDATYSVTVQTDGNGTASASPTSAAAGAEITLNATANNGYLFKEWQVVSGDVTITNNQFTMPDSNVIIKAIFEEDASVSPTTYSITVQTDGNGTASATPASATAGAEITLSATANSGYHFKEWQVISGDVTITNNKFIMPDGDVTVKAIFEEDAPVIPTTYTITIINGAANKATAVEGETVIITADAPEAGKRFKEWTGADGLTFTSGSKTSATAAFTMPAGDVKVTATYEDVPVTKYDVTVNGSCASTTGAGEYEVGETVTISAGTRSGYSFAGWTSSDVTITNKYSNTAAFAMPAKDVTVTAQWTKDGDDVVIPTMFLVTVKDSDNGEVEASAKYAVPGSTVKLTVTPDEGYELDTLTVKYGSKEVQTTLKNGKYQFTMPYAGVTVTATFKKIETPVVPDPVVPSFDDVAEDTYYFDAVEWAVKNGITTGTSTTTFSPDMTCTRAQAVTFLWRAAGSPEPKSNVMPFEDVAAEAYYYKAVLWAVENGITNGASATTFSPDADCTRAQIVTFLWRSQKSPAITAVNPFADIAAEAYYYAAVLWAVDEKITNGTSETTFSPDADCTRAQIVTFLYRCLGDK